MNADAFRNFFNYHIAENRKIWEQHIMSLSQEQFERPVEYSIGSIRDHVVHMMSVDDTWFCGLQGLDIPEPLNTAEFSSRDKIRTYWDSVEKRMLSYLDALQDETLFHKPFTFKSLSSSKVKGL